MRKMKGIIALLLMLVMAIGMTLTVSAADTTAKSAKITIVGADDATLNYEQVIVADPTTKTGWAIVPGFEALFASFGNDAQSQIEGYIAASESDRAAAIKNANVPIRRVFSNPMTVTSAGLYVIKGTEEGYTYNLMLAYIGFDDGTGEEIGLADTTIKAKKTPETVNKTFEEGNKFVQIGDEVEYTVETTIPYSPKGSHTTLVINDELTGGTFKLNGNNKVEVSVSIGDTPKLEITPDNNKLVIDLSYLIVNSDNNPQLDNMYANEKVTLKYTAIVTGVLMENTASIGNNPGTKVTSYTGKLKITKMNEAGSTNPKALAGATFVVINNGKYAIISQGKLAGWSDEITEACYIVTGDDGTATVEGFDADNKTYAFHEVIAPEGYRLNPNDAIADWDEEAADDAQIAEAVMNDSTLQRLPYTGGSGTAAFTGCGVLLMSLAAGLYFSSKKNKSAK